MSEIDDLDVHGTGIPAALLKKNLRRGLATLSRRGQHGARRYHFANAGRRDPSLPAIPCLDRPIKNYLED